MAEPIDLQLDKASATIALSPDARRLHRAAYPFSPPATATRVSWDGGPTVYAMCAIDALGMSAMLDRPVVITSAEPSTGRSITVEIDHDHAHWAVRHLDITGMVLDQSHALAAGIAEFATLLQPLTPQPTQE